MVSHNKLICMLLLLVFVSCSSTQQVYIQTIRTAIKENPDSSYLLADIKNSPSDLLYVRIAERPRAVMALAFIENNEYKWVSADNAMLIEVAGRVTRLVGIKDKLNYVGNLDKDPLKTFSKIDQRSSWSSDIDYGQNNFGAKIQSEFKVLKNADLTIDQKSVSATMVKELVSFSLSENEVQQWTNKYWYHSESGQLLKSVQKISPDSDIYSLTYVSRIARLPIASSLLAGE